MADMSEKEQLIQAITYALNQHTIAELKYLALASSGISEETPLERALRLKSSYPKVSDKTIAKVVGLSPSTLCRAPEYQRLKRSLRPVPDFPRGEVDDQGNIEAWG